MAGRVIRVGRRLSLNLGVPLSRRLACSPGRCVKSMDLQEFDQVQAHPSSLILDVRNRHDIARTGIIPLAINIPIDLLEQAFHLDEKEFEDQYKKLKPNHLSTKIILYDEVTMLSQIGADYISALGFRDVNYLDGGYKAWREQHEKQ